MKTKIVISSSNKKAIAFFDSLKEKKADIRASIEASDTFIKLQEQSKKI